MPDGMAAVIFGILVIATIILDERLSYRDFPSDFRQAWYTLFLGVALKWGFDLMVSQDWGDLIMVGLLALLLVAGLITTIRNKRQQDIEEQYYQLSILSNQMSKYIRDAIKEGVKEGVKEAVKEVKDNNQK
jgi:hypothetical protein